MTQPCSITAASGSATPMTRVGGIGMEGRLEVDLLRNDLHLFARDSADPQRILPDSVNHPSQPYPGSFEQTASFADCVRTGGPPRVPAEVGRNLVSLTLAAEESARTSSARVLSGSQPV